MMRRQTLQIESEKRAILRTALTATSVLLTLALLALGFLYQRYSSSNSVIEAAEARAGSLDAQFQQCNRELGEKTAILDQQARASATRAQVISEVSTRLRTARDGEISALAHAIYNTPERYIELSSVPPDYIMRRFRYREGDQTLVYQLFAGLVDGKWRLYSNLVAKGKPKN
jgi:hypothetical protein